MVKGKKVQLWEVMGMGALGHGPTCLWTSVYLPGVRRWCLSTPPPTSSDIVDSRPFLAFLSRKALSREKHTGRREGAGSTWGFWRNPTWAGGENVDEGGNAAAADEGQEHVIVEGSANLVIKEVRPPIQNLHFAEGGRTQREERRSGSETEDVWEPSISPVSLYLGHTLWSPGGLPKLLMSRPYSRQMKSECLGWDWIISEVEATALHK